ncbi:Defensin [Frankliniella fusca]|uniref:Defensin n=1 Tax=Frankliniella fusca TaxID=407009 RepID=A0AAE1HZD6_9NEOP|nr:Defensin [Frankliniella fusca]
MAPTAKPRKHVGRICCPVFGQPKEFTGTTLPTYEDVMCHFLFVRREIMRKQDSLKELPVHEVAELVAKNISDIWTKASIKPMPLKSIENKIIRYNKRYIQSKFWASRPNSKAFTKKLAEFKKDSKSLFEVASCRCDSDERCRCLPENRIASRERAFIADQRTSRLMYIGHLDKKVTDMLKRKQERINKNVEVPQRYHKLNTLVPTLPENEVDDDEQQFEAEDPEFQAPRRTLQPKTKRQGVFKATSKIADRFGLSHAAVAAVTTAVLEDKGLVTPVDKSLVVDKSKIRRDRETVRKETQQEFISTNTGILGLYFDGKTDSTVKIEKRGNTYHPTNSAEEHISLVEEPGGKYLGHVASGKSALSSSKAILEYCNQNNINLDKLEVVGCDGTVTNTGHLSGIIMRLESHLNRSLQWQICLLHFNELPLRHLISVFDGPTTGPKCFAGEIGSQLKSCETMPVVKFQPIESDLPSVDVNLLSNDQQYLLNMCRAVATGEVPNSLAEMKPGPLNHARWLTAACRILRLYVATNAPPEDLQTLTKYIVKVYAPVWFSVKVNWQFYNSSLHVWSMIQFSRYLPRKYREIVDLTIERNAYALHPENLLIAMLRDSRTTVRKSAVTMIKEARERDEDTVREYRPPAINFKAKDYPQLIDWKAVKVTSPPVLHKFDNVALESIVDDPFFIEENLPAFPCHTQAVERTVQLVTKASRAVATAERRDGFIRNVIASRQTMPKFRTKAQYNCNSSS